MGKMPPLNVRQSTSTIDPPAGVTANPMDTSPIPTDLIVLASISLVLVLASVSARIFTKISVFREFQLEDYVVIFSCAGSISFIGVLFAAASAGQGSHQWNVTEVALRRVRLLSNILAIVYAPVVFSAKLAILLQIHRPYHIAKQSLLKWITRFLIFYNAGSYIAVFFKNLFICTPRQKIVDPSVEGTCVSLNAWYMAQGAIDITSSFTILILSAYTVYRLQKQTSKGRKFAIAAIFVVGAVGCIASAARLSYTLELDDTEDFTAASEPPNLWSLAELTCFILVACSPAFPQLLRYIRGQTTKVGLYQHKGAELISSGGDTPDDSKSQIFYPASSTVDVTRTNSTQELQTLNSQSKDETTSQAERRLFITVPEAAAHSERPVTPVVPPGLIPPRSRATSTSQRSADRSPSSAQRNLSLTIPEPSVHSSRPVTPIISPGLIPSRQPSTQRRGSSAQRSERSVAPELNNPFDRPVSPISAVGYHASDNAPVSPTSTDRPASALHPPELASVPDQAFPTADRPVTAPERDSAPFERPISHISYDSYATANIAELLDEEASLRSQRSQTSMMSIAPISPLGSPFSTPSPQLRHARQVSISHPTARIIARRVDVRVSIHTNPGTPITFARPEPEWDWVPPPGGR